MNNEVAPIQWIFRGLPGSGKTTLANKFGCLVVEPFDHISRIAGKYNWNPSGHSCEAYAMDYVEDMLNIGIRYKMDIAISEVLPKVSQIDWIVHFYKSEGFQTRVVDMPLLSVEQLMQRNTHNVLKEDIERFHKEWQPYPNALTPEQALSSVGIK